MTCGTVGTLTGGWNHVSTLCCDCWCLLRDFCMTLNSYSALGWSCDGDWQDRYDGCETHRGQWMEDQMDIDRRVDACNICRLMQWDSWWKIRKPDPIDHHLLPGSENIELPLKEPNLAGSRLNLSCNVDNEPLMHTKGRHRVLHGSMVGPTLWQYIRFLWGILLGKTLTVMEMISTYIYECKIHFTLHYNCI